MFDSASRSEGPSGPMTDLPRIVRVDARLRLAVDFHNGANRIADRREEGAFRFRFPRAHGRAPEAILVNVAGGLAGGDRVTTGITIGEKATLAVSSAAAERIYRSAGTATELSTRLAIEPGGSGLWLPQETILHDGARLKRHFEIDLAEDSALVFGELLYFGRRASGEGFGRGELAESWRVRRGGRLIFADETRLSGDFSNDILHPTALGEHVALATLLFAAPDGPEHIDAIRETLLEEEGLEGGATLLDGLILIRFAAANAALLRNHFMALAEFLARRIARPMPRALSH